MQFRYSTALSEFLNFNLLSLAIIINHHQPHLYIDFIISPQKRSDKQNSNLIIVLCPVQSLVAVFSIVYDLILLLANRNAYAFSMAPYFSFFYALEDLFVYGVTFTIFKYHLYCTPLYTYIYLSIYLPTYLYIYIYIYALFYMYLLPLVN